tara:strand:+ start:1868 stop:2074 length:207 start_codon:yes stop_codon:yes gene_type:complete
LWRAYRITELETPERTDYYIMKLIQTVEGILGKGKNLNEYHIPFSDRNVKQLTPEEATRMSKYHLGLN